MSLPPERESLGNISVVRLQVQDSDVNDQEFGKLQDLTPPLMLTELVQHKLIFDLPHLSEAFVDNP